MKRITKFFIFSIILCMFFISSMNVSAEVNTVDVQSKLQTNSEYIGKKFRVGMLENYYQICLSSNNSVYIYNDVKILKCSETVTISNIDNNGIRRNKYILNSEIVGFSIAIPRGYGYTLLYGMGMTNDSKTNDSNEDNTDLYVSLGGTYYTICTTEVVNSSAYYSNIDRNHKKATLYMVADVVKVKLTVKQFQIWWWGNQELFSQEVTAYVICNLHDFVEYSD